MAITAGDIRATMTLDASGFSRGVAQAQADLSTITDSGARVANAFTQVEARMGATASAVATAMRQAGDGGGALAELAAKAEMAGARLSDMETRANAARSALDSAQQAARSSADTLDLLQQSAAASADNLAAAREALEALHASGTATAAEIQAAQTAVADFDTEVAQMATLVADAQAVHDRNSASVDKAAASYQRLSAQIMGAEVSAQRANAQLDAVSDTLNRSPVSSIASTLAQMGTSTLTSASRSLGSMAASAAGIATSTAGGTLAARGMSTVLRTLTRSLGSATMGYLGLGASAAYGAYQLVKSLVGVRDVDSTLQAIIDENSDEHYSAALSDVELSFSDEDGIKSDLRAKVQKIMDTLTDGKADTSEIVKDLDAQTQAEYSALSAQVDEYFTSAINNAETEGAKEALQGKWDEVNASIGEGKDATLEFTHTYAGKSTAVCKEALTELEEIYARVQALTDGIQGQVQLLNSQYGDAYQKVAGGYFADDTDLEWALTYVNANHINAQADAKAKRDAALAAVNDAFTGKDGSVAQTVSFDLNGITYETTGTLDGLTKAISAEYARSMTGADNELRAQWDALIGGLIESGTMGTDVTAAAEGVAKKLNARDMLSAILDQWDSGELEGVAARELEGNFDLWSALASALGGDASDMKSRYANLADTIDIESAHAYLTGLFAQLDQAIAQDAETMDGSMLARALTAAMDQDIFGGIEGIDTETAESKLRIMIGQIYDAALDGQDLYLPDLADLPDLSAKAQAALKGTLPVEPEISLPSPEDLTAQIGPVEIEPEISLPAPEELTAWEPQITGDFQAAGDNAGSAFVDKLATYARRAASAAGAIGREALRALRESMGIKSPSKRMRELGRYTGEGYALGIEDTVVRAESSIRQLTGATTRAAGDTRNFYGGNASIVVNASVRSDSDIRKLTRQIGQHIYDAGYGVR